MNASPFISVVDTSPAMLLSVVKDDSAPIQITNSPRVALSTTPLTLSELSVVNSVADAEDIVLSCAEEVFTFDLNDTESSFLDADGNQRYVLSVWMNRVANLIAQATHRGAANIVLINPSNIDLFRDHIIHFVPVELCTPEFQQPVGRWNPVGTLHKMHVYACEDLDANLVFIAYLNPTLTPEVVDSAGGVLIQDGVMGFIDREKTVVGETAKYIKSIKIIQKTS